MNEQKQTYFYRELRALYGTYKCQGIVTEGNKKHLEEKYDDIYTANFVTMEGYHGDKINLFKD